MSVVLSRFAAFVACLPLALLVVVAPSTTAQAAGGPLIIHSSHNDLSAPLVSLNLGDDRNAVKARTHRALPGHRHSGNSATAGTSSPTVAAIPSTTLNFDGIGQGFSGPSGTFSVASAPPDTNGATGPNHFIQTVNSDFAIFNKSGARSMVRFRSTRSGRASAGSVRRTTTATRRLFTTASPIVS